VSAGLELGAVSAPAASSTSNSSLLVRTWLEQLHIPAQRHPLVLEIVEQLALSADHMRLTEQSGSDERLHGSPAKRTSRRRKFTKAAPGVMADELPKAALTQHTVSAQFICSDVIDMMNRF
jgi:hypothetical protein